MKNLREKIFGILTCNKYNSDKENDLIDLFCQAIDEVIGEDDNLASITHRVENVRTGYNLAKAEQRERLNQLIGKEEE